MREIKFRARTKSGEWFYFDLKTPDAIFADIDWETVCEFTGLLDKNGKEIYEGDIVSMNNGQYNCEVIYDAPTFEALHRQSGMQERLTTFIEENEVIGNIYSNPELKK